MSHDISLRMLRRIPRDVWLALPMMLTFSLSYGGISAVVMNLYLLRLGYGPEAIGLINAVGMLGFALPGLPAGILARRWSGRWMMIVGKALEGGGLALISLAELVPAPWRLGWLVTANILSAVGGAVWWVNYSPFLVAAAGPEERDRVFSFSVALGPVGRLLGSLLGGVLPGLFAAQAGLTLAAAAPYRHTLLVSGLLNLLALPTMFLARDVQTDRTRGTVGAGGRFPFMLIALLALVNLLATAGMGPLMVFGNVYLDAGLHTPTSLIGALLALSQLVTIPAALAMPSATARWGRFRLILGFAAAQTAALTLTALVAHWTAMGGGLLLGNAANLLAATMLSLYALERLDPAWHATVMGAFNTAMGLGLAAFTFSGGYLITAWSYMALFGLGAAFSLAGGLVFGVSFRTPSAGQPQRRPG